MKKIMALVLALVMILPLAFAACDQSTVPPTGGTSGGNQTNAPGNKDETKEPPETKDPNAPYEYQPNAEAKYSGCVGVSSNGSAVEFQSLTVKNRDDKHDLYEADFSAADPFADWTFANGDKANFTVADPKSFAAAEEGGASAAAEAAKVLSVSKDAKGTVAYFGEPTWNYIQFAVKARLTEEGGDGFSILFCVKDEKNYHELVVGDKGNTYATVNVYEDGKKTELGSFLYKLHMPTDTDEAWVSCSITFELSTIKIFVSGNQLFELYADEETVSNPLYGGVAFGMWLTGVSFDNIVVKSNADGSTLYSQDFEKLSSLESEFAPGQYGYDGEWTTMSDWLTEWVIADDEGEGNHGKVLTMTNSTPKGCALAVTSGLNNQDWTDYTLDVDARIDIPNEGWIISVAAKEEKDNIFWNIGGWGNSVTCFQTVTATGKSGQQEPVNSKYEKGQWYHITLVVKPTAIYGYIDGYLIAVHNVA